VVTRPLGASFADYFSKPHSLSGAGFGDGRTALVTAVITAVLVVYLAVTRRDIQPETNPQAGSRAAVSDDALRGQPPR
jgi:uncharacterized membrane-anchored protein